MTEPTGWPHMLPCPFCGGDARHDAHADDCYFILHRKFKNSGADMSPAFEVLAAWNRRALQPSPTPQADSSQDEPLQAFDSPRAKALMRAWEEGWAACRDAEYVGEEAQNDAFNSSHTLTLCIAEDQQLPAPQADSQPAPVLDYPQLPRVGPIGYASVVDIDSYVTRLTIGPHLVGVRDVALWTTDQMRAYADETYALRIGAKHA